MRLKLSTYCEQYIMCAEDMLLTSAITIHVHVYILY